MNYIQKMNSKEGWKSLADNSTNSLYAWKNSNIAYVIMYKDIIIGYVRGLTDKYMTLYISEFLIDKNYRGYGIGTKVLRYIHSLYPKTRMDLLASAKSYSFYKKLGFHPLYGFRAIYDD